MKARADLGGEGKCPAGGLAAVEPPRRPRNPRVLTARHDQKAAQFCTDFVEAEISMGFQADEETVRILANSIWALI